MNNSKLAIELSNLLSEKEEEDKLPYFREREGKLITVLEAIRRISESKEWSSLKEEIFEKLSENLKKEIFNEAIKEAPDVQKLNRLSGELKWAEKYADLGKLENIYRLELAQVRMQLYGTTQKKSGS